MINSDMEVDNFRDEFDDQFDEPEVATFYVVTTAAFCGMSWPHGEFEDLQEAIDRVNARVKWAESQGCEVTDLGPDRNGFPHYEIGEPENCGLIPDYCGVLGIRAQDRRIR